MKVKFLITSLIGTISVSAQNTYIPNKYIESNEEAHFFFIVGIVLLLIVVFILSGFCIYLTKKNRSNRRRIHDLRIDIRELRDGLEVAQTRLNRIEGGK